MADRPKTDANITPTPTGAVGPSSAADIAAFVQATRQAAPRVEGSGRLIFALDATMSRQPTWDQACVLQAEMFDEVARGGIGAGGVGLDVQLVYFRGLNECRASRFVSDARSLGALMTRIDCRSGHTQIGRVLTHALAEARVRPVQALVYVGDAMEEHIDSLAAQAGELSLLGTRIFVFHEGDDARAEAAFRDMAKLTGGAYVRFAVGAARELGALLRAVAAYASGGAPALKALADRGGAGARLLLQRMDDR